MRASISGLLLALSLCATQAAAATVTFGQIDWLDGNGGYFAFQSEWGAMDINFDSADIPQFTPQGTEYVGWLNVVTTVAGGASNNWAVENVPIVIRDLGSFGNRSSYELTFDLGIPRGSQRVSALNYAYTLSQAPLPIQPAVPLTVSAVEGREWLFGGLYDPALPGTGLVSPGPAVNSVGGAVGDTIGMGGHTTGTMSDIPSVNEKAGYCVPGAIAHSLKYLDHKFPGLVPVPPPDQIANELGGDSYMKTGPKGTFPIKQYILDEKADYVRDKNLKIITTTTTSFFKARDYVQGGWDVELTVNYDNNLNSGHMAFVTDITPTFAAGNRLSSWQVNTVSDGTQNDNRPDNTQMTFTFEPDGTPRYGNAFLSYFLVECVVPEPSACALAIIGLSMGLVRRRPRR